MDRLHKQSTEGLRYKRTWHSSVDGQHRPNMEGNEILGTHGLGTPMEDAGKMGRVSEKLRKDHPRNEGYKLSIFWPTKGFRRFT
jgi:hypothetical protein